MGLLMLSTVLDFIYGFSVASPNRKKAKFFLWLSIVNNLGILGVFKYYNFFALQFKEGLDLLGLHTNPVLLNIALPVGISFYTFHGMSYVFDIYRGQQKPVKNFVNYAVFVSFFPLLVAGPIERASHLLPQVQKTRKFNYTQAVEGCRLILWGMFKKVVIADSLTPIVDAIFNNYQNESGITLIIGAIAFSFQIYGDFSGYSDIALGIAKLFGFELLSNFKFPYFSRDIAEFWRRWHISLSSWFKDYLYIPLGGSKEGKWKALRNTFIIFLVSGFWHGASWNFIAWGFIHACGFLPLLLLKRNRRYTSDVVAEGKRLPSVRELIQMLGTFAFVTLTWVFFRMSEISDALRYIFGIIGSNFLEYRTGVLFYKIFVPLTLIFILLIMDWYNRHNERNPLILKYKCFWFLSFLTVVVLIHFCRGENNADFIYFQF
jgi:D-alanyl-lipoteichoic acid acyltransferase DltB (MBOAT superfamily)